MEKTEKITPLDVRHGDTLIFNGYRVTAGYTQAYPEFDTAYYVLNSAPTTEYPQSLPDGCEGIAGGGGRDIEVTRVVAN